MASGSAPTAKNAREGSKEESVGSNKNDMTRFGSVRLESRSAMANWKPVVKLVKMRRMDDFGGDSGAERV